MQWRKGVNQGLRDVERDLVISRAYRIMLGLLWLYSYSLLRMCGFNSTLRR